MDLQTYLDQLQQFTSIAWGKPQALVKRLPHRDIEFIDLSDFVKAFKHLTGGILKDAKILIREEYRTALKALRTDRYQCGAYVLGQPGIGKTYFLIYLLVHFLGENEPVAMQPLRGAPFYMLFRDTVTVHPLSTVDHPLSAEAPLLDCKFVWALCDSNSDMTTPNNIFKSDPDRIRIIQATSPQESHYKHWSKQTEAQPYIMDIWTKEEIESLAILLGQDCKRMISLARKWGAVPRTILGCMKDKDQNIEKTFLQRRDKAIKDCQQIEGPQLDVSGPSYFYFYRPEKLHTGEIDREHHYISVPTRTLRDLLAQGLVRKDNSVRIKFYRILSNVPGTRQTAGQIYETWFHRFFTSATNPKIQCQWVEQDSNNDAFQLAPTLRGTTSLIRSTPEELKNRTPPYYWVPPRSNFPGIDSILVLKDRAFAFRVTIGWNHTSPLGGLQMLGDWSPKLKKLAWRVVFIGPEQEPIQKVANSWVDQVWFPTNAKLVPIAWSVTDPVHPGIDWETYGDESDEVMGI